MFPKKRWKKRGTKPGLKKAGADHPTSAFHPEGEYLEVAVLYAP